MLPDAPGTYALVLRSERAGCLPIGRLGQLRLHRGWYVYVGSAFGPGGLRARVGHHLQLAERPHWHIDYLRPWTQVERVWYCEAGRVEHGWAASLASRPGATVPLPGFGSSDCECAAHLIRFEKTPRRLAGSAEM